MKILCVVSELQDWPDDIPGVTVLPAQTYLLDPAHVESTPVKVFNLCRDYRYQSEGYYVSLLAEARGHHPLPAAGALKDLYTDTLLQDVSDLHELKIRRNGPGAAQPSLAILHDPERPEAPSNPQAIRKFAKAAEVLGMRAETITPKDIHRVADFDALFIRDTTNVDHYTYRLARRAADAGMVVIDDPDAILRCTNKIYLNELLSRHHIPTPKTMVVHKGNIDRIVATLGLPFILKQPDSAFSLGVTKIESEQELAARVGELLRQSELVLAQEYLPTEFDWRVGVLDRRPLFVCKYYMAPGHWQVIKREPQRHYEGRTEALSVGEAPDDVVNTAVQAAGLIGDGFYGVDLKQVGTQCYVIEINDNPNVDAGNEDAVLHDALYREVMGVFRKRIEASMGKQAS